MARENQHHPHTRAVKMAVEDQQKVIDSFKQGPKFMQDPVSSRTQARQEAIASDPQTSQLQDQGYSQEFLHRLARVNQQLS